MTASDDPGLEGRSFAGRVSEWLESLLARRFVSTRHLAQLLVLVLVVRAVLSVSVSSGLHWDFVNFFNAGSRVYVGDIESLYVSASVEGEQPELQYVGFPLTAYLLAPLGAFEASISLRLFKLACALCLSIGLVALYRHLRSSFPRAWPPGAGAVLFACWVLAFEPFWFVFVVGGQTTPFGFMLLVLFVHLFVTGRLWPAAGCLALAILVKPFLALMGFVFLFSGRWGLLARLAVWGAAAAVLSVALLGWQPHVEWVEILLQESSHRWSARWWNNASVTNYLANFWTYGTSPPREVGITAIPPAFQVLFPAYKAFALGLFGWLSVRVARADLTAPGRAHSICVLAILFPMHFSTLVWPHYLEFLFVALALLLSQPFRSSKAVPLLFAAVLFLSLRVDLVVMFVLGVRWSPPETILGTALLGLLGSGALMVTAVLMMGFAPELLLERPLGRASSGNRKRAVDRGK